MLIAENFVFKIVPMLNPDGVIVGNYRCSLAGVDLNRTYKCTVRDLYPTVHCCKMMMQRLARDRPVVVYIDLHGHSRKQNVFVYGCDNREMPQRLLHERIFPMMMHLNVCSPALPRSTTPTEGLPGLCSSSCCSVTSHTHARVLTPQHINILSAPHTHFHPHRVNQNSPSRAPSSACRSPKRQRAAS